MIPIYIEIDFPVLGGVFLVGLLLGLFIQKIRINIAVSHMLRAEQKMLKMNAEMLGMGDAYVSKK